MKTSLVSLLLFAACGAASSFGQAHSLEKKWESEATLKVPESVLFDSERQLLYVTNIDGAPWGRDDKGSVGKLGLDGEVLVVDWVTGLQAPKGMALREKHLYVADLGEVVVIDVEKGEIAARITVEGAKGLNDVSIDKQGVVFVTDSEGRKLYRIENGEPAVVLENLKGPNGVLAHDGAVYIVDGQALYRVMEDRSLSLLADGMTGGIDGIEHVASGNFLVSCWSGTLHYVTADGTRETLLDTREQKINAADIGYDAGTRTVYVPTFFKNSVVAYTVK